MCSTEFFSYWDQPISNAKHIKPISGLPKQEGNLYSGHMKSRDKSQFQKNTEAPAQRKVVLHLFKTVAISAELKSQANSTQRIADAGT